MIDVILETKCGCNRKATASGDYDGLGLRHMEPVSLGGGDVPVALGHREFVHLGQFCGDVPVLEEVADWGRSMLRDHYPAWRDAHDLDSLRRELEHEIERSPILNAIMMSARRTKSTKHDTLTMMVRELSKWGLCLEGELTKRAERAAVPLFRLDIEKSPAIDKALAAAMKAGLDAPKLGFYDKAAADKETFSLHLGAVAQTVINAPLNICAAGRRDPKVVAGGFVNGAMTCSECDLATEKTDPGGKACLLFRSAPPQNEPMMCGECGRPYRMASGCREPLKPVHPPPPSDGTPSDKSS